MSNYNTYEPDIFIDKLKSNIAEIVVIAVSSAIAIVAAFACLALVILGFWLGALLWSFFGQIRF